MPNHRIAVIAGIARKTRALGKDGDLLEKIPGDMEHFRAVTRGKPVLMGRRTWESIPKEHQPLPGRLNIVVTSDPEYVAEGAIICRSLTEAIACADEHDQNDILYVIGGARMYEEALPLADIIDLTEIETDEEGDVFFPDYEPYIANMRKTVGEEREYNGIKYRFVLYEKVRELADA